MDASLSTADGGEPYFGVVDYCVMSFVLLISIGIGLIFSFIGNKSPEDFLMGSRSFSSLPVAMSLLTSYLSAISLLGFTGDTYKYGSQFAVNLVGCSLGIFAVKYISLPVLFPLNLTSVNEYVELRFRSKKLRIFIMILGNISTLLYVGNALYAPTIALSAVTPLSIRTYIFILGGVTTLYSAVGGIKAVVWTDVFQFSIMAAGMIVIVVLGCLNVGGFLNVWSIAAEGERLELFNMNIGLYERHTFWNTIIFGFWYVGSLFGVAQLYVQRLCSVKTINDANKLVEEINHEH